LIFVILATGDERREVVVVVGRQNLKISREISDLISESSVGADVSKS
jgi:hypothetical protein